ncbi:MAG TPA: twin-arginine translocase TatA/TatE family subunit [Methylomirabilota bacterium]|nr:twin-arginine translocase TatA/TatE family subunit [Methylomirabilota bacterium]
MNLGSTEILLIVLVILLLFGPSQIPKMARGFGQAIREFKKAQREISDELEREPPQGSQPPKGNGSDNKPIH